MKHFSKLSTFNSSPLKIWTTVLIIILPFIGLLLGMIYQQNITFYPTRNSFPTQIKSSPISQMKTYENTKYRYSVKYPQTWSVREFPTSQDGAAFRPSNAAADDFSSEFITIGVNKRTLNDYKVPFEEYVKGAAGKEIQNYESLESIEEVVTNSGVTGYMTTWNVRSLRGGELGKSLPITYFDYGNENGDSIQISLNSENYIDEYNTLIRSLMIEK